MRKNKNEKCGPNASQVIDIKVFNEKQGEQARSYSRTVTLTVYRGKNRYRHYFSELYCDAAKYVTVTV